MAERIQSGVTFAAPTAMRPVVDGHDARPALASPATTDEIFTLVYRQVRKLAGNRDVDELAQAAAEQVLRSLPAFAGQSTLSTWTFRICYLTIRKHDRWLRRWLRRFAFTDDGLTPEVSSDLEAFGDERLVCSERASRLRAALDLLSARRRAVVVLHDLEGFSVDEVAHIVDADPIAVRSRLRDGRKALAQHLARDPYFGLEACHGKVAR
jgi:RNA polymerase sigma-70 factor (ECF subfamily)